VLASHSLSRHEIGDLGDLGFPTTSLNLATFSSHKFKISSLMTPILFVSITVSSQTPTSNKMMLVFLLSVLSAVAPTAAQSGIPMDLDNGSVIGGENTDRGEYPYYGKWIREKTYNM